MSTNEVTNREANESWIEDVARYEKEKYAEMAKIAIDVMVMARCTHLLESGYRLDQAIAVADGERSARRDLFEQGHRIEAILSTMSFNGDGDLGMEFVSIDEFCSEAGHTLPL